jgi:hypothetical protein
MSRSADYQLRLATRLDGEDLKTLWGRWKIFVPDIGLKSCHTEEHEGRPNCFKNCQGDNSISGRKCLLKEFVCSSLVMKESTVDNEIVCLLWERARHG